MGYQISNLGPGHQSGDHKLKAIQKYPDTGVEPVAYGLRTHCSTELVWIVKNITLSRLLFFVKHACFQNGFPDKTGNYGIKHYFTSTIVTLQLKTILRSQFLKLAVNAKMKNANLFR